MDFRSAHILHVERLRSRRPLSTRANKTLIAAIFTMLGTTQALNKQSTALEKWLAGIYDVHPKEQFTPPPPKSYFTHMTSTGMLSEETFNFPQFILPPFYLLTHLLSSYTETVIQAAALSEYTEWQTRHKQAALKRTKCVDLDDCTPAAEPHTPSAP